MPDVALPVRESYFGPTVRPSVCFGKGPFGREFLAHVDYRQFFTVTSGWLRGSIYFQGLGFAWILIYGYEMEMILVRIGGEADYEFSLTGILLRLQYYLLNEDNS